MSSTDDVSAPSAPPLTGVTVIDAASLFAGPLVATFLGDYGSEVIKIEHPAAGDSLRQLAQRKNDIPLWWKQVGRNKKSITLYLGSSEGQDLFKRLVTNADVVIENYRTGTMERWGLGWEALSQLNPRLVMLRVTGFGQTGPYRSRPGFGTLAEAMSGFAHITGDKDGPPTLPPFGLADGIAAITGAFAVMMALYDRDRTGLGQYIDLSLYEPIFSILGPQVVEYAELGIIQSRIGNRVPFTVPRGAYRTKDNKWVALSGSSQAISERVFRAIGHSEMNDDPRFQTMAARVENVDIIDKVLSTWMAEHTREEILRIFEHHEAALGPVYDVADIFQDPHFRARENIVDVPDEELGKVTMQGVFPKMSRTPGRIQWAGPPVGKHNHEIYVERLGLDPQELERLHEKKVI